MFCVVCEEFVNVHKVDDHCKFCKPCEVKYDLRHVNDKLIKMTYMLNHKSRGFTR